MKGEEIYWTYLSPEEIRKRRHPNFRGNRSHLRAFTNLASTPSRSDERQDALIQWVADRRLPARRKVNWESRTRRMNLRGANLRQITLGTADLRLCDFQQADLRGCSFKAAMFQKSDFRGADLRNSLLMYADFRSADLSGCDLRGADLSGANLTDARLVGAKLSGANLEFAQLVKSNLKRTDLRECRVYGAGVWNVHINSGTKQGGLIVEEPFADHSSRITVNGCDVAQFMHLFLDPGKIFDIISTTTDKLVLILGRFNESRKPVLDEIRRRLPDHDQVGIIFDFEFLDQRTMLETVLTLAQMSRFTLADLTGARLVVHEVQAILERLSGQIVQPIHSTRSRDIAVLREVGEVSRNTYLPAISYKNTDDMIRKLPTEVLPAVDMAIADLKKRDKFSLLST